MALLLRLDKVGWCEMMSSSSCHDKFNSEKIMLTFLKYIANVFCHWACNPVIRLKPIQAACC